MPCNENNSRGTFFVHPTAPGSETQTTHYAGNGGQGILFYPWGQVWQNPSGAYGNSLYQIFASLQLYDTSTDGYVPPFRYYVPEKGRWLTPDLLGGDITNPQSLNRYAYVLNNPTSLIDPLGLQGRESGCPGPAAWGCDAIRHGVGGSLFQDPFSLIGIDVRLGTLTVEGSVVGGPLLGDAFGIFGDFAFMGGNTGGAAANKDKAACISTKSLNWSQKAQLLAAQFYAGLTGWTFGFGAGTDAGAGVGSPGSAWNVGIGGSASTLIAADASGNSGFLNSISGGVSFVKMGSAGSWWGAGAAAGPSFLVSPNPISKIAGRSGSVSAGGGAVLGAGISITTSGAATVTFGAGVGAEAGASPQIGTSQFIPFCKD